MDYIAKCKKRCPWCGGKASYIEPNEYAVLCGSCGAKGPPANYDSLENYLDNSKFQNVFDHAMILSQILWDNSGEKEEYFEDIEFDYAMKENDKQKKIRSALNKKRRLKRKKK